MDLKIILLDLNNYVERLNIDNKVVKNFNILAINLNVLHNYLYGPTKLFSDSYLAKLLDISANRSFRATT